ncbi:substrate-binding domain-containing protein [Rhodococcus sp. IEGM 1381]|uniref:LacI family DNA-binding transcriptional regulator n=1 Tax=Rhodococcus sp. IEGM 1381 TaxID=3047085 RepID=UPI0024B68093|nr:substrate-binding domain-containing protein [Rhodococcus sp. IEGM 1381]MDI9893174.1 substrate-binding domain-containing protein [Rhodococcus sp. IEGM 1381]
MRDVASAAEVSQAAVSYAFSSSPKVSPAQRDRILDVAASLGYRGPQSAASSLRRGRVGVVGVVVADALSSALDDPSTTSLMKGIVEVGELADVALTLLSTNRSETNRSSGASAALRGLVDGVILHDIPNTDPIVAELLRHDIPTVAIDSPDIAGIPLVTIDHREAAREQMRHIVDLGHRHIGVVTDRLSPHPGTAPFSRSDLDSASDSYIKQRLSGYFDVVGDTPGGHMIVVEAFGIDRANGMAATDRLLALTRPTAIAATSDVHAAAALAALRNRHIASPGDISVIGFDDAPIAEMLGLTTIRQPLVDKGKTAAKMLLDRIDGQRKRRVTKRTQLVVRSTTGRVKEY